MGSPEGHAGCCQVWLLLQEKESNGCCRGARKCCQSRWPPARCVEAFLHISQLRIHNARVLQDPWALEVQKNIGG